MDEARIAAARQRCRAGVIEAVADGQHQWPDRMYAALDRVVRFERAEAAASTHRAGPTQRCCVSMECAEDDELNAAIEAIEQAQ